MKQSKKIIKSNFFFGADFGSAWGWQVNHYDDGTVFGFNVADVLTDVIWKDGELAEISPILVRAIKEWQTYFERYATDDYDYRSKKERELNDTFDWDGWNKAGIRLAYLVKEQIGHLYDEFYYGYATEDKDYKKVWSKTRGVKIE
jgi:hypothetical protein